MKVVIKSTLALTLAHAFGYIITLAEVPILARALGPQAYGELLWVQLTALLISVLVDYGFTLSASRQIAQNQSDPSRLRAIIGNVFLAKTILMATVTVPLLCFYVLFRPVELALALAGLVYVFAFGMSPFWYFQGTQKMGRAVAIEIATRTIALLGLIALVRNSTDAAVALWLMASAGLICTFVTSWMCLREVGTIDVCLSGAIKQIKDSTSFFVYKSSSNLVTTAATSVLGGVSGAAAVAIFAPADKVIKAVTGLALPLFNALYPHLSNLFVQRHKRTHRHALILSGLIFAIGVVAAITLTIVGPNLMALLLGPGFEEAGVLLSLMVWLVPLRLGNQALGFTLLLPAGLERHASLGTMFCSGVSLVLGALFAINHGAIGMVWGVLIGELLLLMVQIYISRQMAH